MIKIKDFTDLIVWQKADLMFDMIVEDAKNWPQDRVSWIIADQVIRSIGSVSANIAEGYGCGSKKEYIKCLMIARKENSESLNWLIKAQKRKFITNKRFQDYYNLTEEIKKMLNSIISKLRSSLSLSK